MATTINNTLPLNWDSSQSYNIGDTVSYTGIIYVSVVSNNVNNNPKNNLDYWKPLDIYLKEETVMPHDWHTYSGDENFWERDNVYIDTNGYLYLNNENTGICVNGHGVGLVKFESLTEDQKAQIKGEKGDKGDPGITGEQGPKGDKGDMGSVTWSDDLTPEQIAQLRGKSTYETWLEVYPQGSKQEFLDWVRSTLQAFDTALLQNSTNAVQNQAIYTAFMNYQGAINTVINNLLSRVETLEGQLKATTGQAFIFSTTDVGEYGYKVGDSVVPFRQTSEEVLQSTQIFPSNGIAASQIGEQESAEVIPTQMYFQDGQYVASVQGDLSDDNDIKDNTLYASSNSELEVHSFTEVANDYFPIYVDGKYEYEGFGMYHITKDDTHNWLINDGTKAGEGIMFNSSTSYHGQDLNITIKPAIAGETINYEFGIGKSDVDNNIYASLPSVINGTNRIRFTRGSFDEETTLTYTHIQLGESVYFAVTSPKQFKITKIWMN